MNAGARGPKASASSSGMFLRRRNDESIAKHSKSHMSLTDSTGDDRGKTGRRKYPLSSHERQTSLSRPSTPARRCNDPKRSGILTSTPASSAGISLFIRVLRKQRYFFLIVAVPLGAFFIILFVLLDRVDISGSTPSFLNRRIAFSRYEVSTLVRPMYDLPNREEGHIIFLEAGFRPRPRSFGYYFGSQTSESFIATERLDPNMRRKLSHVDLGLVPADVGRQMALLNSVDYDDGRRDEFEENDCVAQYEWQKSSFPTCNSVHEIDMGFLKASNKSDARVWLMAHGYWRDVWVVRDTLEGTYALKTLRYTHKWEDRNYDRHRRDAVAMERLTASANIMDIYGFCGNTGLYEFADGGDIDDMLWYSDDKWNETEKLMVAYQVAAAIYDVHSWFDEEKAAIAHADITTSQFVFANGQYKLNDFNRCRFISQDRTNGEPCQFFVGSNPGSMRSPEEYAYEGETEKIDIYSMGNIFYTVLTEAFPFDGLKKDPPMEDRVINGERPPLPQRFRSNKDPFDHVLLQAMQMCWIHDPEKRPSAKQVLEFLRREMIRLNVMKAQVMEDGRSGVEVEAISSNTTIETGIIEVKLN